MISFLHKNLWQVVCFQTKLENKILTSFQDECTVNIPYFPISSPRAYSSANFRPGTICTSLGSNGSSSEREESLVKLRFSFKEENATAIPSDSLLQTYFIIQTWYLNLPSITYKYCIKFSTNRLKLSEAQKIHLWHKVRINTCTVKKNRIRILQENQFYHYKNITTYKTGNKNQTSNPKHEIYMKV